MVVRRIYKIITLAIISRYNLSAGAYIKSLLIKSLVVLCKIYEACNNAYFPPLN